MKIKTMILSAVLALAGAVAIATPTYADVTCPEGTVHSGESAKTVAECNTPKDQSLFSATDNLIAVATGVLGLVAVVVVIYGGFTYITATGDAAKIKKAKDTIIGGIVGLLVVLLAYTIVNFAVNAALGDPGSAGTGGGSAGGSSEETPTEDPVPSTDE
ncbi:MAG: amino acid permease [Candidatus Saccharibacteria bacterium]|nr:amino acid permease [Candidatus Saccharibacteria bacterium]